MTGEHDQSAERDPSTFEEVNTGRNSEGQQVGLGVGVRPLDVVLRQRFADMDKVVTRTDDSGIVDSRLDPSGRPRPTGQKPTGRRQGKSTLTPDVTQPATEADYSKARDLISRGIPFTTISRKTGLSEVVIRKLTQG